MLLPYWKPRRSDLENHFAMHGAGRISAATPASLRLGHNLEAVSKKAWNWRPRARYSPLKADLVVRHTDVRNVHTVPAYVRRSELARQPDSPDLQWTEGCGCRDRAGRLRPLVTPFPNGSSKTSVRDEIRKTKRGASVSPRTSLTASDAS